MSVILNNAIEGHSLEDPLLLKAPDVPAKIKNEPSADFEDVYMDREQSVIKITPVEKAPAITLTPTIKLMASSKPVNVKLKFTCPHKNCRKSYGNRSHLRAHLTWHATLTHHITEGNNPNRMKIDTKKEKKTWEPAAECVLVELWARNIAQLRSHRKNGHVYKEMAKELKTRGFPCKPVEVRTKINNITGKYRKEKLAIGCTEDSSPNWPLYTAVHRILGGFEVKNCERIVEKSFVKDGMEYSMSEPAAICSNSTETPSLPAQPSTPTIPAVVVSPSSPFSTAASSKSEKHCSSKKKTKNDWTLILNEIRKTNTYIKEMMEDDRAVTRQLLKHEEQRTDFLKQIMEDNKTFQNYIMNQQINIL